MGVRGAGVVMGTEVNQSFPGPATAWRVSLPDQVYIRVVPVYGRAGPWPVPSADVSVLATPNFLWKTRSRHVDPIPAAWAAPLFLVIYVHVYAK